RGRLVTRWIGTIFRQDPGDRFPNQCRKESESIPKTVRLLIRALAVLFLQHSRQVSVGSGPYRLDAVPNLVGYFPTFIRVSFPDDDTPNIVLDLGTVPVWNYRH